MKPGAMFAAAFALCLAVAPTLAVADSGGKDDTSTCPRGEAWDARQKKCVKVQGSVLPDKVLTDYAAALSKAGRYDEATIVDQQKRLAELVAASKAVAADVAERSRQMQVLSEDLARSSSILGSRL